MPQPTEVDDPSRRRVVLGRLVDAISPPRLGPAFRWLLASSWSTNIGDGIALAAGPLLIASQTRNPTLVALGTMLQRLPWLLFGLFAGVVADRRDRRRLIIGANLARAFVLVALVAIIGADRQNVAVVLAVLFAIGSAEVFADTTTMTLMPMIVERRDLGIGNARLIFGRRAINDLIAPPIGAAIFAAGLAWPFMVQIVTILFGTMLIARLSLEPPNRAAAPSRLRADIVEGVRWLWHSRPVRALALTIVLFNVTFGATWSVLVLYAIERLDMGEVGFGLLLTATAVGGIAGSVGYGWLEAHVSLGNLMRVGLTIETLTHFGLAMTTVPVVAMAILVAFGAQATVWGTTSTAVRQRAVPLELQGRVASVYAVGVYGGLVAGAAVGGAIAAVWGVVGAIWFGFAGSAVLLAAMWNELAVIAHADDAL